MLVFFNFSCNLYMIWIWYTLNKHFLSLILYPFLRFQLSATKSFNSPQGPSFVQWEQRSGRSEPRAILSRPPGALWLLVPGAGHWGPDRLQLLGGGMEWDGSKHCRRIQKHCQERGKQWSSLRVQWQILEFVLLQERLCFPAQRDCQ